MFCWLTLSVRFCQSYLPRQRTAFTLSSSFHSTSLFSVESESLEKISAEIKEAGDKVRELKAAKVDKAVLDVYLSHLLNLKDKRIAMTASPLSDKTEDKVEDESSPQNEEEDMQTLIIKSSRKSRDLSIRPTLDDVERISKGQAAKRRGTGSRQVPHRLNESERKEWDLAKQRKYLLLRGSGWRKERGDSPLANIYRQFCDSTAIPCISVRRGIGIDTSNDVVIDLSPLRTNDISTTLGQCRDLLNSENFNSLQMNRDHSDISTFGWEDVMISEMFINDPIWRIPVHGMTVTFGDRAESKRFASLVAQKICGAVLMRDSDASDTE